LFHREETVAQGVSEDAMDQFRETAVCLTLWHGLLTLVVTVLAIALHDLDAPAALLAAATVALLFALVLMARAGRLTERNVTRGRFWRTVPPRHRPPGQAGVRLAYRALQDTWLRFAKGAAMLAIVLAGLASVSNGTAPSTSARAARAPAQAAVPDDTAYRSARLLRMNL
jgi:hypothetical protein